jgi:carboxymethylenebutenolidase
LTHLNAPVLGLYGAQDASIPMSAIDKFKEQLTLQANAGVLAAKQSRMVIYPDVGHAFHADYRATYNPVVAKDGWSKTLDWFKTYL